MRGINLIPPLPKGKEMRIGRFSRLAIVRMSIILLAIVALLSIGGFTLQFLFRRDIAALEEKIVAQQQMVDAMAAKESLLLSLRQRLAAASQLPPPDTEFTQTIDAYERAFGGLGQVENLTLQRKSVTFSMTVKGASALETFLDAITSPNDASDFALITVDGITKGDDGVYTFTVTAERKGNDGAREETS